MATKLNKVYLYLGIGLPIALLCVFMIVLFFGRFVALPHQDVLFVSNPSLQIKVENNLITIKNQANSNKQKLPQILRFNPRTQKTIKYQIIKNNSIYSVSDFPKQVAINTDKTSKDGYSFICKRHFFYFSIFSI